LFPPFLLASTSCPCCRMLFFFLMDHATASCFKLQQRSFEGDDFPRNLRLNPYFCSVYSSFFSPLLCFVLDHVWQVAHFVWTCPFCPSFSLFGFESRGFGGWFPFFFLFCFSLVMSVSLKMPKTGHGLMGPFKLNPFLSLESTPPHFTLWAAKLLMFCQPLAAPDLHTVFSLAVTPTLPPPCTVKCSLPVATPGLPPRFGTGRFAQVFTQSLKNFS